jgi:hypothetical protein
VEWRRIARRSENLQKPGLPYACVGVDDPVARDVDMTVPVHAVATSAFDLPDHLARKADPALIAGDEQHFAAIAESLEHSKRTCPTGSMPSARRQAAPARRQRSSLRWVSWRVVALMRYGLPLPVNRPRAQGFYANGPSAQSSTGEALPQAVAARVI